MHNDAKDLDIVMPMCSLFEYSDNCSDIRKFVEMLQMQNWWFWWSWEGSEGKSFNCKRKPIREKTEVRRPRAPAPTERGR